MSKTELLKDRLNSIKDQLNFLNIEITFYADNDRFVLDLSKSKRTQFGIMNIIERIQKTHYTNALNGQKMVDIVMYPCAPDSIDVTIKSIDDLRCDYYLGFIEIMVYAIYQSMDDVTIEDYYKDRRSRGYSIGPTMIHLERNDCDPIPSHLPEGIPANMERNNYLYRDKISEIDHVKTTFVCPNCLGRVSFNLKSETTFSITSDIEDFAIERYRTTFIPMCTKCEQSMFECDEDFVDRIIKLNLLGIVTEFCCSGHENSIDRVRNGKLEEIKDFSYPYIMINVAETEPQIINIILTNVLQKNRNLDVMFMDEDPYLRISPKLPNSVSYSDTLQRADQDWMKDTLFKFVDTIIKYFDKEDK